MHSRIITALALALMLAVPSLAAAQVPAEVPVQGFLTDDTGVPVDGSVSIDFKVYDAATGGNELHAETLTVDADAGAFTAYLTPSLAIFADNDSLYLGLAVDGEDEMSPRLKMATVPYAAVAGDAATVQGMSASDFAPSDYQPNWDDIQDVPADIGASYTASGALEIDANNEIGLISTCPDENVLKWDAGNSQWACAADEDEDTTYSAGAGVEIDASNVIGLNSSCASGQLLKWDGSQWACQTDLDTTYLAGDGLQLTSNQFAVDYSSVQQRVSGTCPNGEFVMGVHQDGSVLCGADTDTDTDTTYGAGAGLALNGTTFSVAPNGITSTEIADGTIADADVAADADIAAGKIAGTAATLDSSPTFNGDVTADDFNYASPKSGRRYISIHDFQTSYSDEATPTFISLNGYMYVRGGGPDNRVDLDARVELPNGATVTEFNCLTYDNLNDSNALPDDDLAWDFNLRRLAIGTSAPATRTMATSENSDTVGSMTNFYSSPDTSILYSTVDNSTYTYYISGNFTPDEPSFSLRFYGCYVDYDVDSLQP